MGYHITILRTDHGVPVPLQLEEIKAAMAVDSGWQFMESNQSFVKRAEEGEDCVLWLEQGELWSKTPSERSLAYMIEVAKPLRARVRGDELETYESVDKWYVHPDDAENRRKIDEENSSARSRAKRRRWLSRGCVVVVFFCVGAVYNWLSKR